MSWHTLYRQCQNTPSSLTMLQTLKLTVTTLVDTLRRKYRSWETAMTAPSNFMRASSSISLEGMSRWLVGSSSTRKVPCVNMNLANAKRAFSPPLKTSTCNVTGHDRTTSLDTANATDHEPCCRPCCIHHYTMHQAAVQPVLSKKAEAGSAAHETMVLGLSSAAPRCCRA